ncbi:hypothetical protein PM082_013802 [Marasmius tenuissimus]|nr:hypothetical protein PM082_013802 [Marasmius tenuissimus]
MGAILFVTVAVVQKWYYPYMMNDLERQIACVEDFIEQNTTLERGLLGDMEWSFRDRLVGEHRRMSEIQEWATVEPKRWRLLAWVGFRRRQMREVKRCYCSVIDLKRDVMMEVNQSRHDLLEYPA